MVHQPVSLISESSFLEKEKKQTMREILMGKNKLFQRLSACIVSTPSKTLLKRGLKNFSLFERGALMGKRVSIFGGVQGF